MRGGKENRTHMLPSSGPSLPDDWQRACPQKFAGQNGSSARAPCGAMGPLHSNSGAFLGTLSAMKEYRIADSVIAPKARVKSLNMAVRGTMSCLRQCHPYDKKL